MPELQAFTSGIQGESPEIQSKCKMMLYDFFERHLSAGDVSLGVGSGGFDSERKSIDTIVIHHTSNPPGLSEDRLSAIELVRLYGPYFANPPASDMHLKGTPLFSGHQRNGKQVFWPYHWIVRMDGRVERLLSDAEIGWHAGNWDINCRSAAIALDNDYDSSKPSALVLNATARLILSYYRNVSPERIFGHLEVNVKTTCPSNLFLPSLAGIGWKVGLIKTIDIYRYNEAV